MGHSVYVAAEDRERGREPEIAYILRQHSLLVGRETANSRSDRQKEGGCARGEGGEGGRKRDTQHATQLVLACAGGRGRKESSGQRRQSGCRKREMLEKEGRGRHKKRERDGEGVHPQVENENMSSTVGPVGVGAVVTPWVPT